VIKPGPDGWLLDTSVVIHLVRRTPTGAALTTGYAIDGVSCPAYLCVVSHGEVESFALYNNWGARRQRALAALLRRLRGPVDLSPRDVIESYARIDHASRAVGRRMGKNDLWIAAVAYAYQLTLLTTDADFDHLHAAGWLDVVRQPVLP
jgi:predicted nucleic acid-binding protein